MSTLKWQKIARYQLDNLYQTDICALEENEILAVILLEPDKLEKHISKEQLSIIENIKLLLLTKIEDQKNAIEILSDTSAIIFGKSQIKSKYNPDSNFANWLNTQAPIPDRHYLAFFSTKTFYWEYTEENELADKKLSINFKLKISILPEEFMFIVENWLRRQDIMHLCEINEIFNIFLTSINFLSMLDNYNVEDIVDNSFVQEKLAKKIDTSLSFFDNYGLKIKICGIEWEAEKTNIIKETLTTKIEKGRKESPIDNIRYDQLQIKRIIDEENVTERDPDQMIKRRTQRQKLISQITETNKVKKDSEK